MNIAAAVLAAGASARMGAPKQLLRYQGETLVRRAARIALEAGADPVVVVLGDAAELVARELEGLNVATVLNTHWRSGIASSIRSAVQRCSEAEALLVLLCDQPGVNAAEVKILTTSWRAGGQPIAAAGYAGSLGVPAIFHRSIFPELMALQGDQGAKPIILADEERVTAVTMEAASLDVDTPEDASRIGVNRSSLPD